jgi:hypothetical protein
MMLIERYLEGYENQNLGQAALRALQNHPSQRRGDGHLFQPQA